jgi:hypothetical protein
MRRRDFLAVLGLGVIGCDAGTGPGSPPSSGDDPAGVDAGASSAADASTADACARELATMHDTEAQALYLDGSYGPLTGTITVASVVAGTTLTLDFWHGHGGQQHRFTLTPAMFADLKAGNKITVGTSTVDGHAHTLFIDPKDERYRTPGAPDVPIDLGCA